MGSLIDSIERSVLDHMLKVSAYAPSANRYLALSTANPLDTGAGMAEPSGAGYARQLIIFSAATTRAVTQSSVITFPEASGSWGTITHYAIYDNSVGGNIIAYGALTASRAVIAGNIPSISAGEVVISIGSGGSGTAVANSILNWLFRGQAFSQPVNLYLALCKTSAITDSDTGLTITELAMTGYGRVICSNWNAASGLAPALSDNANDVDFGILTGAGETCVAMCVIDTVSGDGNIYAYTNDPSSAIATSDDVKVLAGAFNVTLT